MRMAAPVKTMRQASLAPDAEHGPPRIGDEQMGRLPVPLAYGFQMLHLGAPAAVQSAEPSGATGPVPVVLDQLHSRPAFQPSMTVSITYSDFDSSGWTSRTGLPSARRTASQGMFTPVDRQ